MKEKVYISGKVTGMVEEAILLFKAAENELRQMGFEPVNPITLNHQHDQTWHSYMREDVKALCDCDAIYMLTNWRASEGAKVELSVANHLELDVMFQHRFIKPAAAIRTF